MKQLYLQLTILFTLLTTTLKSQDVVFSQYYNTPLHTNPSFTGNFEGNDRMAIGYRDQWRTALSSAAYRAGFISYDSKINLSKNRSLGYGASATIDRAGVASFGSNLFKAHGSFSQQFGSKDKSHHNLSAGLEMGISNTGIALNNKTYFDLGFGVLWEYQTAKRFGFQVGTSVFHINKPNISISSGNFRLYRRFNLHGVLNLPLTKRIAISPSFLTLFQGPHSEHLTGLAGKYIITSFENKQSVSLLLGVYVRSGRDFNDNLTLSSVNFISTLQLRSTTIGLSYDYYLNGFGGGIECTAGYIFPSKRNKQRKG